MSKQEIRRAVLANRGGLEEATDAQVAAIWMSLDTDTQIQYLASIKNQHKKKGKSDAANSGGEKDV